MMNKIIQECYKKVSISDVPLAYDFFLKYEHTEVDWVYTPDWVKLEMEGLLKSNPEKFKEWGEECLLKSTDLWELFIADDLVSKFKSGGKMPNGFQKHYDIMSEHFPDVKDTNLFKATCLNEKDYREGYFFALIDDTYSNDITDWSESETESESMSD